MQTDPRRYDYRISWSEDDQEFVATVEQFPSLSWLDLDQSQALEGCVRLVAEILENSVNTDEVPD
jgi:hypothetical protein